ncbi:MAG: hypothetical protein COT84_00330 [Chlamydiae bacterium CG10_big_fil_rev_8_21_14_0_10_35_9]|nr:MAG: hypothetical protein COT84_00330 [Chlamydiae bacterium CG10_big_fil_rev_8_21_14_0_10_35_9]
MQKKKTQMFTISFQYASNDKKAIQVFINDTLEKVVAKSIFRTLLKTTMTFETKQEAEKWLYEKEVRLAKSYAYFLLSLKNYPSSSLQQKLQEKHVSSPAIQEVMNHLHQSKYVNDEKWLESFVDSQLKRGWGPIAIFFKVKQKKINMLNLQEKIAKIATLEKQQEAINSLMQKQKIDPQKLALKLRQKGFDSSVVAQVVVDSRLGR